MRPPPLTTTAGLTKSETLARLSDLLGSEVVAVLRDGAVGASKAVWGVRLADNQVLALGTFERLRETEALSARLSAIGLPGNQITSKQRALALRKLLSHGHGLRMEQKR